MTKYADRKWIGSRFGDLKVVDIVHKERKNGGKQWYWKVLCDCGKESIVRPIEVLKGHTKSCGCLKTKRTPKNKTHGESRTRLHDIWCGMHNRCKVENKNSERYGKRGISICKEWSEYEAFSKWAIENGYKEDMTIERKDVNGNYCPENCKWIPMARQARNRRTTFWVMYNGQKMSLVEAAEKAGLPYKQVHHRIKRMGWTAERALSTPMARKSELHKKCDELGLNYHTVYNRIRMGWSEERAIKTPVSGVGANQTTYK